MTKYVTNFIIINFINRNKLLPSYYIFGKQMNNAFYTNLHKSNFKQRFYYLCRYIDSKIFFFKFKTIKNVYLH